MVYHYCRVSTREQNLDRQLVALNQYKSADKVFCDKQSGKNFDREQYQLMKSVAVAGDEIIIKELDRLGRNKDEVKNELQWFKEHGVVVRILDVATTLIDFQGQQWIQEMVNNLLVEVLSTLAEQERNKTKQRQAEGYAVMQVNERGKRVSAKTGKEIGRPEVDVPMFEHYLEKQQAGDLTVVQCCKLLGISRATWFNLKRRKTA